MSELLMIRPRPPVVTCYLLLPKPGIPRSQRLSLDPPRPRAREGFGLVGWISPETGRAPIPSRSGIVGLGRPRRCSPGPQEPAQPLPIVPLVRDCIPRADRGMLRRVQERPA